MNRGAPPVAAPRRATTKDEAQFEGKITCSSDHYKFEILREAAGFRLICDQSGRIRWSRKTGKTPHVSAPASWQSRRAR
jgi:hypothetical protein